MIFEFALEPEVLSKPESIRYFLEQFDVHKGRLIAEFPKHWSSLVYKMWARQLKPVERKRYGILLESLSDKILASDADRPYVSADWLENAESVQDSNRNPFRAIVAATNPRSHSAVLVADDVDEATPLWHVKRQDKIERKPAEFARVATPLIQISKHILLIDPYFDPCNPTFQSSLRAMLTPLAKRSSTPARIELHCVIHSRSSATFWSDCKTDLPGLIPTGIMVSVIRWTLTPGGERFHRRYVLTERGGLAFEGGLDRGADGQTTDVYILEAALRTERWKEYQSDSTSFARDADGPVKIVGTRRMW